MAFLWEKVKTVDFSETIAACDLKVGRCRELIEIMKVYEYLWSRSFLYHIFSRTFQSLQDHWSSGHLSRIMRKPAFCLCENKGEDNHAAFLFAAYIVQSNYFLNKKLQASGHLLKFYECTALMCRAW